MQGEQGKRFWLSPRKNSVSTTRGWSTPPPGAVSCLSLEEFRAWLSIPKMEGIPVFDGDRREAGKCSLRSLFPHTVCD